MAAPKASRSRSTSAGITPIRTRRQISPTPLCGKGGSMRNASISASPCSPSAARSSISSTRHSSGNGKRAITGGGAAAASLPASTISPPSAKLAMPIPERMPRASRAASPAGSGGRSCKVRSAAATARAICVPEPRPRWAGWLPPRQDGGAGGCRGRRASFEVPRRLARFRVPRPRGRATSQAHRVSGSVELEADAAESPAAPPFRSRKPR